MKITYFNPKEARVILQARAVWLKQKLSTMTGKAWSCVQAAGRYFVKPPMYRDTEKPYKRGERHE